MSKRKKVVIAGASGLVGVASVNLFSSRDDWEVVAISRRSPGVLGRARYIGVDLLDRAQCQEVFGAMSDVTHLVYAAVNEQTDSIVAGWSDKAQIDKNEAMLVNVMDPLLGVAKGFQQVSLVHGAKAYGTICRKFACRCRRKKRCHGFRTIISTIGRKTTFGRSRGSILDLDGVSPGHDLW